MSDALKICPQCGTEYPANERFCPRDGTALRSQGGDTDLVGTIIADRYHILKKLGEGGMGQVYLAEHVKMGRKSAVKVMNPGMVTDVDAISRFNREAANASRINHPNVAGIYDFGETKDGVIYLAMEFIEGQSLTSLIAQQGALAPVRAAEITRQAADGLAVAHDMGIVHRDLKPDNIMIARTRDGGDLVKVVDFGIAKAAGNEAQKVTKTGLVVGTPEYMSPEQLSGDKLDGRSDIYSLGLVAFNMLTGVLPFPSDSMQETMIMRLTDRPKTLTEMKPDVAWPADVQAVMDKALERDANLRYQSASKFGLELFQAIERMPVTKMVAAGTQVLGPSATAAVPAPRPVAGTAPMPATRVSPHEPLPQRDSTPTPPAKRNSMALVGAVVAAVVVLGAGGALVLSHGTGNAKPPAPPASVDSAKQAPTSAQQGSGTPKPTGTTTPTSPPPDATTPAVVQHAGGLKTMGAAALDKALEDLLAKAINDTDSVPEATTILDSVRTLRQYAKTNEQIVKSALVEGIADYDRDDNVSACAALSKVKGLAASTTQASLVASVLKNAQCQGPTSP